MKTKIEFLNDYKKLGVIGSPINHSLSPLMQNYMIKKLDIPFMYLPFHVGKNQLKDFFKAAELLEIGGFNCTIPHKEESYLLCDRVFGDALVSKSVNTVKYFEGKFLGYSTDGEGFNLSLTENGASFENKKILLIGAGGAARALVITGFNKGADFFTVINRNIERGKDILKDFENSEVLPFEENIINQKIKESDIIINCTPLGMESFKGDFSDIVFPDNEKKVVCDLIYKPSCTKFLKAAKEKGHLVINGLGMLIYQGILALQIFTDREIDVFEMKKDVEAYIIKALGGLS